MNIGILTFHRALNIGAVLQTFALFSFVKGINKSVEIIDYTNEKKEKSYLRTIKHLCRIFLQPISSLRQYYLEKKFEIFRKKYLKLSNESYCGDDDIFNKHPKYDCLISGSDQIFNTTITNNSKAYYLFFDNCGKKISYASSFGRDEISLKEIEYIKSELPKFNALSVREKNAGELIKLHTGISPLQVLDPVFLLNRYEWGMIEKDVSGLPKKYIFVYAMEFSENLERTIRIVRQQFGFPVIVKVGGASANRLPYKKINCDPAQFLYLLNKASIVITNSFHGMAFAFIYGKKFYAVAHSKRNARLDNLMTLAGFREKIISSNDNISESEIDGLRAYKKIIPYIESSKKYLEINLK